MEELLGVITIGEVISNVSITDERLPDELFA